MKKIAAVLATFCFIINGFSQEIHSPDVIFKLLASSKISYQIKKLDNVIDCPDYSKKLNYHNSYRVVKESRLETHAFTPNDNAKPYFKKAEELFQSNDFTNAYDYYLMALAEDSTLYCIMTYVGQLSEKKNNNKDAMKWYQKAINKNYIDYMAHWFLADACRQEGDLKQAIDEIVIARILNRNNPRIKKSMANILKECKRDTTDWYFNPQVELTRTDETKVNVAVDDKWMAYGLAKALWLYEPGYKESMGVPKDQYSTIEDRECLLALIVGQINAKIKIKNDPQLRILKEAADKGFLSEYIIYEILLPKTPFAAYQLPVESILRIKDYILTIRNKV